MKQSELVPAVMAKSAGTSQATRSPLGIRLFTFSFTLPIPSSLPPSPIPIERTSKTYHSNLCFKINRLSKIRNFRWFYLKELNLGVKNALFWWLILEFLVVGSCLCSTKSHKSMLMVCSLQLCVQKSKFRTQLGCFNWFWSVQRKYKLHYAF